MSVTVCPHCNHELDVTEDSIYCERCGGNIMRQPVAEDAPNARLTNLDAFLEDFGTVDVSPLSPYYNGVECPRWATVTTDGDRHFIAAYATEAEAMAGFADEMGGEVPWMPTNLVDLDTGERIDVGYTVSVFRLANGPSMLPTPPDDLADAWRRFRAGEHVEGHEARALDEWRTDCARDAGF